MKAVQVFAFVLTIIVLSFFTSCTKEFWQGVWDALDGTSEDSTAVQDSVQVVGPDTIWAEGRTVRWDGKADGWKVYIGDSAKQFNLAYGGGEYPNVIADTVWTWRKFRYCEIVRDMDGKPLKQFTIPDTLIPNGSNNLHYDPERFVFWIVPDVVVVAVTKIDYDDWPPRESDWGKSLIVRLR